LHYAFWGLYNGIVIALSDIFSPVFTGINKKLNINSDSKGMYAFRIIRTFVIVNVGWYFDRIISFENCIYAFKNTLTNFSPDKFLWTYSNMALNPNTVQLKYVYGGYLIAIVGCFILLINSIIEEKNNDVQNTFKVNNVFYKYISLYACLFLTLASFMFTGGGGGFLYANF